MQIILPCLRHAFLGAAGGDDMVAKDSYTARGACEQPVFGHMSYGSQEQFLQSRVLRLYPETSPNTYQQKKKMKYMIPTMHSVY